MVKKILLITNKEDVTTDCIVNILNKEDIKYYRFNTEDYPLKINLNLDIGQNIFKITDLNKKIEINLEEISSVYFRRPKLPEDLSSHSTAGEKRFLLSEIAFTYEGFYKLLVNRLWINSIFPIREAENKIYQLNIAKIIGFKIPSSIITNDKNYAENFIKSSNKEYIVKPIRDGLIDDPHKPKIIFTSLLTKKQINSLKRIKICPVLIQEKIEKRADIRVTVVGNKVFTTLIESQKYEETKIDWRKNNKSCLEYRRYKLPNHIERKCVALTKKLNLVFSAIDLILDNNGDFIFLEINPNGQWAWIEKRLNYDISYAIVDILKKGKKI